MSCWLCGVRFGSREQISRRGAPRPTSHNEFLPGVTCYNWIWAATLCCVILVSIQLGCSKKIIHAVCVADYHRVCVGWKNRYIIQSIGWIPNNLANAWYQVYFWVSLRMKIRVIKDMLWYTWYIFGGVSEKNEEHVICVAYFFVSLIKRNTSWNDRSWYVFGLLWKKDVRQYLVKFWVSLKMRNAWYSTWYISEYTWKKERP